MVGSTGGLAAAYGYDEFGNTTIRAGKHYKKYKLTSVNCVWITIQLLRKGKISKA